jgi:transposase IS4-like protein
MARTAARLPDGTRISDHVTLGVLTTTVPAALIDAVLAETGRQSQRYRRLPARLVVYYVMALALYAQASYGEVLRCLVEGVRWLRLSGTAPALADKSAICRARTRLGPAPLKALYARIQRRLPPPTRPAPGMAGAGWSASTAPRSICPTRPNSWSASAVRQPRAARAAFRNCAC